MQATEMLEIEKVENVGDVINIRIQYKTSQI